MLPKYPREAFLALQMIVKLLLCLFMHVLGTAESNALELPRKDIIHNTGFLVFPRHISTSESTRDPRHPISRDGMGWDGPSVHSFTPHLENNFICFPIITLTQFSASVGTLFSDMSNRVQHQKRNQMASERVAVWYRFWCSTRLPADTGTY